MLIIVSILITMFRYTEMGIRTGGPLEFGYDDLDFVPLGTPYVSQSTISPAAALTVSLA